VKATAKSPHRATGLLWLPSFIDIFPPQVPPRGDPTGRYRLIQVETPFEVENSFIAKEVIETVTIHDAATDRTS